MLEKFLDNWKTNLFATAIVAMIVFKFFKDPASLGMTELFAAATAAGLIASKDHDKTDTPEK
jgi:hypothetical protein